MNDEFEIGISWESTGKTGVGVLTIAHTGGVYTDKLDITKKRDRERVLGELYDDLPGLPLDDVREQLEEIASKAVPNSEGGEGDSQADQLVALTEDDEVELFHAPGERDTGGYATVDVDGRQETWPIPSTGFKGWLRRGFYRKYRSAIGGQAMADALGLIEAKALFEGEERPVSVRIAAHGGDVFIDLGADDRRAVHVTAKGWRVVESKDVPVRFVRRTGMLPLPVPTRGGSVEDLRPLVNLPTDELWVLFIGTLVAFLLPIGPYAILVIYGEHGSAKSTLAKMGRKLIDPNQAPLRRTCRTDEDLMIAAANGWMAAFDNLSNIRPGLADSLCSLATGAAFATRKFYTNDEEKLFEAMRPVMVNGIDDLATRADFLDRSVLLELPCIDEAGRREEKDLWAAFDEAAPGILGALLDGVSSVLRNRAGVNLSTKPRMADFATCVTAAEEGLGWEPGAFMAAYQGNRADANRHAIESVAVGPGVERLMETHESWTGTSTELLTAIEGLVDERSRGVGWPKNGRGMSGALKRIAPNLRAIGIDVDQGAREPGGGRRRITHLQRRKPRGTEEGDCRDGSVEPREANRPGKSTILRPSAGVRDGRDDRDGCVQHLMGEGDPNRSSSTDPCPVEGGDVSLDLKSRTEPSRPSRPSRSLAGDPEKADSPGRLRDGCVGFGTVEGPDQAPRDGCDGSQTTEPATDDHAYFRRVLEMVDGVEVAPTADVVPLGRTSSVSRRCYCCGGTRRYRGTAGGPVCAGCHPPDRQDVEWLESGEVSHG